MRRSLWQAAGLLAALFISACGSAPAELGASQPETSSTAAANDAAPEPIIISDRNQDAAISGFSTAETKELRRIVSGLGTSATVESVTFDKMPPAEIVDGLHIGPEAHWLQITVNPRQESTFTTTWLSTLLTAYALRLLVDDKIPVDGYTVNWAPFRGQDLVPVSSSNVHNIDDEVAPREVTSLAMVEKRLEAIHPREGIHVSRVEVYDPDDAAAAVTLVVDDPDALAEAGYNALLSAMAPKGLLDGLAGAGVLVRLADSSNRTVAMRFTTGFVETGGIWVDHRRYPDAVDPSTDASHDFTGP